MSVGRQVRLLTNIQSKRLEDGLLILDASSMIGHSLHTTPMRVGAVLVSYPDPPYLFAVVGCGYGGSGYERTAVPVCIIKWEAQQPRLASS